MVITNNKAKSKYQETRIAKKYGFGLVNREVEMVSGCLTSRKKESRTIKGLLAQHTSFTRLLSPSPLLTLQQGK